ncbi:MAG: NAD(P)H-quinone oxidoreductase subunit F [Geitlerinemataceae cyanobacterium]
MADFFLHACWFLPLYGVVGALLTLPWSSGLIRKTGQRPAAYVNILMTVLVLVHGVLASQAIVGREAYRIVVPWLRVADLDLSVAIDVSPVALGGATLVALLCLLAQVFGLGYLEKEASLGRFYGLMGLFQAALVGIALSDSLLLSYGLLELLTLSTYLLVGFWYAQPLVVTAARDAFLTKRVGDIILLMGIVALSSYGSGLTFSELEAWAAASPVSGGVATLLGLSLIAGPVGKCAQFPLHLWLDESMEGPNPASILRNSVVVSAGAYVLIRLEPVFGLSPIAADVLVAIGTVTAIGTSLMTLAQIDIKRALSYSTSAFMGLVFVAVGCGQVDIALLLLFAHAMAKALLFMSIGGIILNTSSQNLTELGGLGARMPVTALAFVVGAAGSTCLLPSGVFLTFRHWIEEARDISPLGVLLVVNLLAALSLTRLFRLVFLGPVQIKTRRAPEVNWLMAVPLVSLTLLTLLMPVAFWHWDLLAFAPLAIAANASPIAAQFGAALLLLSGAIGFGLGLVLPLTRTGARSLQPVLRFCQDLLADGFYIERFYRVTVVWAVAQVSRLSVMFDRYIVDGLVNATGLATLLSGQALRYSSSGQSQTYVLTILVGTGLLVFLAVSWPF